MLLLFLVLLFTSACARSQLNCCLLSTAQLTESSTNPNCPIGESIFDTLVELTAKRDECPDGTCRIGTACYCPQDFLQSDAQQQLCEHTLEDHLPLYIRAKDVAWRSRITGPSSNANDDTCCSLTRAKLEDLAGTSPLCSAFGRGRYSYSKTLSVRCDRCPAGTCRIGVNCYCPRNFLNSVKQREACGPSFMEKWERSVRPKGRIWRSGIPPNPSQDTTFDNCCSLSNEELEIRKGNGKDCSWFGESLFGSEKQLSHECDPCPLGTCRVGNRCLCPGDFISSDGQKEVCRDAFGQVHPNSVGLPDKRCPSNPVPDTLSAPMRQAENGSEIPVETESPTLEVKIPTKVETSNVNATKTDPPESKNSESGWGGKLTVAEIIGIITGIVSTVCILVTWLICWQRKATVEAQPKRSERKKQPDTFL